MKAMLLRAQRQRLELAELPVPEPAAGQMLIRMHVCAVCRTDLHVADGELPDPKLPLVAGHQVVGVGTRSGARVRVPWLGWTWILDVR